MSRKVLVTGGAGFIGRLLDRPVAREQLPPRPGDIRESWADITVARELLGYEAHVGFEEGLPHRADFLLQPTRVGASRLDVRR